MEKSENAKNEGIFHLSGLNGIRAIAALAVVISHTTQSLSEFNLNAFIFGATYENTPRGLDLASFGVSMFFALSGFLITYLLLLEKDKTDINIKKFYIRRILRIHPLYYSYLAISLIIIFFFQLDFAVVPLLYYIFFSANIAYILGTTLPFLAHYWSIGVEEQFYIFYPWIVKKWKNLATGLMAVTTLLIIAKFITRLIAIKYDIQIPYLVLHVTRFQCMLIGAIGSVFYYGQNQLFIKFSTNLFTQIISWFCIFLISINYFHIFSVFDQELISIITVFIIVGQITKTNRIFNLDGEFFDFIGKISYGIYVVHPLIIFLLSKIVGNINLPSVLKYPLIYLVVLALTIILSYLSYEYFEKKFLKLKNRYSTIKTSGTKHN